MNYTKLNENIQFEAIVFFLEDDYLFASDMLIDTIRFFSQYNPCFVYHPDHADRCPLNMNDGLAHQIIPKSSRTWRSIARQAFGEAQKLDVFPCSKVNEQNLFAQ